MPDTNTTSSSSLLDKINVIYEVQEDETLHDNTTFYVNNILKFRQIPLLRLWDWIRSKLVGEEADTFDELDTNAKTMDGAINELKANIDVLNAKEDVIIDDALSGTSTNPVENKVIKEALDSLQNNVDTVESKLFSGDYNDLKNKPTFDVTPDTSANDIRLNVGESFQVIKQLDYDPNSGIMTPVYQRYILPTMDNTLTNDSSAINGVQNKTLYDAIYGQLYYNNGDIFSGIIYGAGYITNSGKEIRFNLPLPKSFRKGSDGRYINANFNISQMDLRVRQNGKYLYGSADTFADLKGVASVAIMDTGLIVSLVSTTAPSGYTNNDAVGINCEYTMTLNYA